jgi:hypothetical protein
MPRWVPPEPGRQARLGVPAPHNDFTHSCLLPAFNAARGASTAFEVTILYRQRSPESRTHSHRARPGGISRRLGLGGCSQCRRLKAPVSRRWIQPILSGHFTDGMETVGAPERAASAALAANVSFAAANAGIGKCVDYGWRGRRRRSYSSTSKKIRVLV